MRDPRVEQFLDREKVDYRYDQAVSLSLIDRKRSLMNQARPDLQGKLDPGGVERCKSALEAGMEVPALVGYWLDDLIIVAGGNHRVAAYDEEGRQTADMYILQTRDPTVLDRITRSLNIVESSIVLSREAVLEHAKHYVRQGHTQKDASLHFLIPENAISKALVLDEAKGRLQGTGLRTDSLSATHLVRLNGIQSNPVMARAAKLVLSAGLTTEELGPLVTRITECRSESEQLAQLVEAEKQPDIAERITKKGAGQSTYRKMTPLSQVKRNLGANITHLASCRSLADLGLTGPEEIRGFRRLVADHHRHLTRLFVEAERMAGKVDGKDVAASATSVRPAGAISRVVG